MTGEEADRIFNDARDKAMPELVKLSREEKIKLIDDAKVYKSGPDSVNTVYMGSSASHTLKVILGHKPTKEASDNQLDRALYHCFSIIEYMQEHPITTCPCCGGITPLKKEK